MRMLLSLSMRNVMGRVEALREGGRLRKDEYRTAPHGDAGDLGLREVRQGHRALAPSQAKENAVCRGAEWDRIA